MKIFILATGTTGGLLARLLRRDGYPIACGDADPKRAMSFAGDGIEVIKVNARRCDQIAEAAAGCDLLVNCVPAKFNRIVLRAALQIRGHYLDLAAHLGRTPFKPEQLLFGPQFVASDRCAVINAGAAPGLSNLLAAEAAARFDNVDSIKIRLFEDTDGDQPVSTWSAEVAWDEAMSRPRIYRNRRYKLARRFDEFERFSFPPPIGTVPVVLAAQDEIATLPRLLRVWNVDAKIGGNEISRLRQLYLDGRLRPSRKRGRLFPDTLDPAGLDRLIRRGALHNARSDAVQYRPTVLHAYHPCGRIVSVVAGAALPQLRAASGAKDTCRRNPNRRRYDRRSHHHHGTQVPILVDRIHPDD